MAFFSNNFIFLLEKMHLCAFGIAFRDDFLGHSSTHTSLLALPMVVETCVLSGQVSTFIPKFPSLQIHFRTVAP